MKWAFAVIIIGGLIAGFLGAYVAQHAVVRCKYITEGIAKGSAVCWKE